MNLRIHVGKSIIIYQPPPLRVKTKFDQTAPMENIYMYVNFIYVCYSMYVR